MSAVHSALSAVHNALSAVHSALSAVHNALSAVKSSIKQICPKKKTFLELAKICHQLCGVRYAIPDCLVSYMQALAFCPNRWMVLKRLETRSELNQSGTGDISGHIPHMFLCLI